ncbi:t-SNARE [Lojkania enalia]|uniref:t-SNARE n=1 Tax=Lojkania enalia TaxID=147567 RepID=A0A9P4K703_9PLEO|nr:t-SNARE [Didymosphaeria enalia]
MSYGGYQQYGGNPYGQSNPYGEAEAGYGGYGDTGGPNQSNPYYSAPSGHETSNPYGGAPLEAPPALNHGDSNYSQGSQYSAPSHPPTNQYAGPLSKDDFFARIEGARSRIRQLSSNIQEIGSVHQRLLSSPDSGASAQLEAIVTNTQVMNTGIKDEIKYLERDAAREPSNNFKQTQVDTLKRTFKTQLEEFQQEERNYENRYREAIARQYRIVNPEATEDEIQEAANANWGDEGIFQTALKSNRSGQAASVLGAVRARHNDIQRIEKTMMELATLFEQLNEHVVIAEPQVAQIDDNADRTKQDTKNVNIQLDKGIASARRARKLKWWTLAVCVAIVCILALVLGLYFGLRSNNNS